MCSLKLMIDAIHLDDGSLVQSAGAGIRPVRRAGRSQASAQ